MKPEIIGLINVDASAVTLATGGCPDCVRKMLRDGRVVANLATLAMTSLPKHEALRCNKGWVLLDCEDYTLWRPRVVTNTLELSPSINRGGMRFYNAAKTAKNMKEVQGFYVVFAKDLPGKAPVYKVTMPLVQYWRDTGVLSPRYSAARRRVDHACGRPHAPGTLDEKEKGW